MEPSRIRSTAYTQVEYYRALAFLYTLVLLWRKYKHNRSGPGNFDCKPIAHSKVTAEGGAWRFQRVSSLRADGDVDRCMFGVCRLAVGGIMAGVRSGGDCPYVCIAIYIVRISASKLLTRNTHGESIIFLFTKQARKKNKHFYSRTRRARETITFIPQPAQEDQEQN